MHPSYIANLWHLAEHCEFGTTLNAMLWDSLVCSMEEPRIQRWLLAESDLMSDKAFELVSTAEAADKDAKELQSTKLLAVLVNHLNNYYCQQKLCNHCGEPLRGGLSFQDSRML